MTTRPTMTAKIRLSNKMEFPGGDYVQLSFAPDYEDGRNKEWATATPALYLQMNVKKEIADKHNVGDTYTLPFMPSEDVPNPAQGEAFGRHVARYPGVRVDE